MSKYLGQTGQLTSRTLSGSTLATTWSYLPNSGDRRLSGIDNIGLAAGQYSNYIFTTTPENFISGITESSDASSVYPAAGTQTATYNNLNQLTDLSGQALTFDADGNLTSDGQRTYSWDAENRLLGIGYPGQPGKATAFTYDGLGRRVSIASTPSGGGSAVATSYLWCGSALCQARDAGNTPIRGYYDEGEYVPGSPAQPYYYGVDQIRSVRRAFASTSSAPAYSYDPYGVPLQSTTPVTDFVYGGMFYNADSGLYLTQYRAYDAAAGRWLSRDPFGEVTDPVGNLYPYAHGNPVSFTDPLGLLALAIPQLPTIPSAVIAPCSTNTAPTVSGTPTDGPPAKTGPPGRPEPTSPTATVVPVDYKAYTEDRKDEDLRFYNSLYPPNKPLEPNPTSPTQRLIDLIRRLFDLNRNFSN